MKDFEKRLAYMSARYSFLNNKSNEELIEEYHNNKSELYKEYILLKNYKLIFSVKQYYTDQEDVNNESITTILQCIEQFEPSNGTKFSTYCIRSLKWNTNRYTNSMVPSYISELSVYIKKYIETNNTRQISDEELAEHFGEKVKTIELARNYNQFDICQEFNEFHETNYDTCYSEDDIDVDYPRILSQMTTKIDGIEQKILDDLLQDLTCKEITEKHGFNRRAYYYHIDKIKSKIINRYQSLKMTTEDIFGLNN